METAKELYTFFCCETLKRIKANYGVTEYADRQGTRGDGAAMPA
jgi:hypothetical protein